MTTFFLILQIVIAVFLVLVILIQRTSTDGLSGLGGNTNNVMSSQTSANLLTKLTTILAVLLMVNSLVLAKFSADSSKQNSVIDEIIEEQNKDKGHKKTTDGEMIIPMAE